MPPKRDLSEFNYGAMSSLVVNQGERSVLVLCLPFANSFVHANKIEVIGGIMNRLALPSPSPDESISRIWDLERAGRHRKI